MSNCVRSPYFFKNRKARRERILRKMKRYLLAILIFAGCVSIAPKPGTNGWTQTYGKNFTLKAYGEHGFTFEFPKTDGVHYITKESGALKIGQTITVAYSVSGSGFATVQKNIGKPCWRLMIQKSNDMWSQFGRYWSSDYVVLSGGVGVTSCADHRESTESVSDEAGTTGIPPAQNNLSAVPYEKMPKVQNRTALISIRGENRQGASQIQTMPKMRISAQDGREKAQQLAELSQSQTNGQESRISNETTESNLQWQNNQAGNLRDLFSPNRQSNGVTWASSRLRQTIGSDVAMQAVSHRGGTQNLTRKEGDVNVWRRRNRDDRDVDSKGSLRINQGETAIETGETRKAISRYQCGLRGNGSKSRSGESNGISAESFPVTRKRGDSTVGGGIVPLTVAAMKVQSSIAATKTSSPVQVATEPRYYAVNSVNVPGKRSGSGLEAEPLTKSRTETARPAENVAVHTFSVKIDPSLWTDVYGAKGSEHLAEFKAALTGGHIGITFGGSTGGFGHGVTGTGTFTLVDLVVK